MGENAAITPQRFVVKRASGTPVSDEDILVDIRHAADLAQTTILSIRLYTEFGQIDPTTVASHFGSWNAAVIAAGLQISNEVNVSDERLFENMMVPWTHYGRQPRRAELARPPSTFSQSPYNRRFGSWTNALNEFVGFANAQESVAVGAPTISSRTRTARDPTLRTRFRVLERDVVAQPSATRSASHILIND